MNSSKVKTATVILPGILAVFFSLSPSAANAITAGDVMDKMESRERHGFIGGAVDMASHLYAVGGNREKADCAVNWFFQDKSSLSEIHGFFNAHKDKDAAGLLSVLINRRCGK
jgi:hypothetical protein